jgi:hypothetical protein
MKRALVALVIVAVLLSGLWALSYFVPEVGAEGKKLAAQMGNSKFWIFVGGLAGPILYAFKRVTEWFTGTVLGAFQTAPAAEHTRRAEEIDRELKALQKRVDRIDADRTERLEKEYAIQRTLEAQRTRLATEVAELEGQLARIKANPVAPRSPEELLKKQREDEGYFELSSAE